MTWNYRVIHRDFDEGDTEFEICEVHYDDDGGLIGFVTAPEIASSSVDGLQQVLDWMAEALQKDVLLEEDFSSTEDYTSET